MNNRINTPTVITVKFLGPVDGAKGLIWNRYSAQCGDHRITFPQDDSVDCRENFALAARVLIDKLDRSDSVWVAGSLKDGRVTFTELFENHRDSCNLIFCGDTSKSKLAGLAS